jgi:CRP/FNR family transcriptional regulator
MNAHEAVQHLPLFRLLKTADRRTLEGQLQETCYGKGQYIFQEGDPADYFYVLKEGAVKCVKSSTDGRQVTMKVLMPGDLFCCEAAAFNGAPHPGCAKPMGDVRVLRLRKKTYFDMLRRNPEAAIEVIKYLGQRLSEVQETAKVLALDRAEQRLASLLVSLAARTGEEGPSGVGLTIRLTRQDLADMAGVTAETAIRIMSRFKRRRLVSGTAKRLVIHDLPKLERLASAPAT